MSDNLKNEKPELTNKNEEEQSEFSKKNQNNYENEQNRKQESRMMNFFNQEFIDRKIDFKPK
jgi:hypothetical protein